MHSVTFILAAIFLGPREGESHKRPQKSHKSLFVVILNITLCLVDINISAVRTTASDKGQEQCYRWENVPVLFAACPLCGFPTYNLHSTAGRTMDRSNAKLIEGVKCLFLRFSSCVSRRKA